MGLHEEFSVIRTQILSMKPTPTLGVAYHLVAEDKQKRSITGASKRPGADTTTFQVNYMGQKTGQQTHGSNRLTPKGSIPPVNEKLEKCTFCGGDGDNKDGCFKRIGKKNRRQRWHV